MANDRASRHFGLPTYRVPVAGRGAEADLFQPRFRSPPPAPGAHQVEDGDRLDTLAFRLTGDPAAFWRLADANGVYDPLSLLEPGRILRIPERGR